MVAAAAWTAAAWWRVWYESAWESASRTSRVDMRASLQEIERLRRVAVAFSCARGSEE